MKSYTERKDISNKIDSSTKQKSDNSALHFTDNRSEFINQRGLKDMINRSTVQLKKSVIQLASARILEIKEDVDSIDSSLSGLLPLIGDELEYLAGYLELLNHYSKEVVALKDEDDEGIRIKGEVIQKLKKLISGLLPKSSISQPPGNGLCSLYSAAAALELSQVEIDHSLREQSIKKNEHRMGGNTDAFFKTYFGVNGRTLGVSYKDKWVKVLKTAHSLSLPICIGVLWTNRAKQRGAHWLYFSYMIDNVLYARDQQNEHDVVKIAMGTWKGFSYSNIFTYTVTQIGIGFKNESDWTEIYSITNPSSTRI